MQNSIRHIERSLFVPLTSDEKEDEVKNLLSIIDGIKATENKIEALKSAAKLQKENLDVLLENMKDSSNKIKHGTLQQVPCKMDLYWHNKVVTVTRKDTFEIVEEREMNENDKPMLTDEIEEPRKTSADA